MDKNMKNSKEKIHTVLNMIPAGRVISYGQLATLAGLPGAARLVGTVLSQLPEDTTLPWHRVVKASGHIAFALSSAKLSSEKFDHQKALLIAEGVEVVKGKINLSRYGWQP